MDNSDDNALDLSSSSVVMAKKSSIANLNTTYTTVATAAATTSIASSSSGGGASRFDKVNIATKIEMMLSDDESNPDNELDDHDDTMDEGIDNFHLHHFYFHLSIIKSSPKTFRLCEFPFTLHLRVFKIILSMICFWIT